MSQTLGELKADILAHLDGSLTGFWTDDQLTRWANESLRDIARRSEVLQDIRSYTVIANQLTYDLPEDMIRIYRVEYRRDSVDIRPLEFQPFQSMDDIWYWSREITGSEPDYYTIWGYPGGDSSALYLFPVPSETLADGLRLFYYRLPRKMVQDDDLADLPAGWEDLVPLYVEVVARRKEARDQRWQEAFQLYEQRLEQMIQVTRQWTDQQSNNIASDSARSLAYWISGTEW